MNPSTIQQRLKELGIVLPAAPERPLRVYLPTDYQPKYAYPLVVLFHADGECEEHAVRLVPLLSPW